MPLPKADWEIKLEQLRATNEELQWRKADAEKDRELFRDLYNKASSYATQVTKENDELHSRVSLAETQVRDGLAMIRATYDARIRKLEGSVARLEGLNALLTAKDLKTQGDAVRRRAAEETELRGDNQRLRAELAELRLDYGRMERLLEQLGEQELEELSEQEEEVKHRLEGLSSPVPSIAVTRVDAKSVETLVS
ncbi:hypothetical protein PHLCEN_2v367 [Hermanssonia centrifuga]|uniref:Uncharacterized protein n=1 Tax=Hermanssonia centrifuga TaxID=98765 RepID=A0A2R6S678_9APHY|nr:hypothetical protein PHLCEN_2v367 [Hermanssonia centrifuga]